MKTIDPGHLYALLSLDNDGTRETQFLRFVKRYDPADPSKFPGNYDAHEGTTSQSVIRALLERARYVDNQVPHKANKLVIEHLRACLVELEMRALERHGIVLDLDGRTITADEAEFGGMCPQCGHVICPHYIAEVQKDCTFPGWPTR